MSNNNFDSLLISYIFHFCTKFIYFYYIIFTTICFQKMYALIRDHWPGSMSRQLKLLFENIKNTMFFENMVNNVLIITIIYVFLLLVLWFD